GVGDAGVDRRAEVDDPLGQQLGVDVEDPLPARALGDDVGDGVTAHDGFAPRPTGCLRVGGMRSAKPGATWSTNPYARASSAVYQWSWSESSKTFSRGWPVSSAM